MGGWAQKTRLRWRWREFRFETLYTTPEITLTSADLLSFRRKDHVLITGSADSRLRTLSSYSRLSHSHEMVSWIPLLSSIHECTASYVVVGGLRLPGLLFHERSWDFQLPDVVRPLANTSVGAIAILARRMGMRWKDFRPVDGVMRAEGNDKIITTTLVRSLGTVMQYIDAPSGRHLSTGKVPKVYIPTREADSWGFGIIQPDLIYYSISWDRSTLGARTRVPTISRTRAPSVGTRQEVLTTLRTLEPSGLLCSQTPNSIRHRPGL